MSDYHIIAESEIEKFFKKLSDKVYKIHCAMRKAQSDLKHQFFVDKRIRARGYFHLHPKHTRGFLGMQPKKNTSLWLLDHIEFDLPKFQFDVVKDYQSRKYFKDKIYFNGNLKGREDTLWEAVGFGPTVIFDLVMTVAVGEIEDLFGKKSEVADVLLDRFDIHFEFKDESKFNELIGEKYTRDFSKSFQTIKQNNNGLVYNTTSGKLDVLSLEEKTCCNPVDCWNNMVWHRDNSKMLSMFLANLFKYGPIGG